MRPSAALGSLSDEAFWRPDHQRDLLHALRDRWQHFTVEQWGRLEHRLLEAALRPWPAEPEEHFTARRAHTVLDALHWLRGEGIDFAFDWDHEITRLRADVPDWTGDDPSIAVEATGSRGGAVVTENRPCRARRRSH